MKAGKCVCGLWIYPNTITYLPQPTGAYAGGLKKTNRSKARRPTGNRQSFKWIDDFEKGKPVEISVSRADAPDSMLAHEDRRVSVVEQIACQVGTSEKTCPATTACRGVGTRTSRPGEARSATMKSHAAGAVHGTGITRG